MRPKRPPTKSKHNVIMFGRGTGSPFVTPPGTGAAARFSFGDVMIMVSSAAKTRKKKKTTMEGLTCKLIGLIVLSSLNLAFV